MIEIVETSINYIKNSLLATGRKGMEELIRNMEMQGFFYDRNAGKYRIFP